MVKSNIFFLPSGPKNCLFNDTLNTFYLRLYGIRHMVKDHSDSKTGNTLPPHRLILSISSKASFMCQPTDRIIHTTAFVTPERDIHIKEHLLLIEEYPMWQQQISSLTILCVLSPYVRHHITVNNVLSLLLN